MAELIHEQEGLRIVKNDINRFVVVTLRYTADPAKRSKDWYEETKAGMLPAKFQKEFEIEYDALFGEKVFPELSSHRTSIVVDHPHPEFPETQLFWGGFDYGTLNPSSFHVYTIHDGITYSVWELFKPCKNIPSFVEEMKACPYWPRIRYIAADPAMWTNNQQSDVMGGMLTSVHQRFVEAGVTNLIKGNNNESSWMATMKAHWQDPTAPTFKIFSLCVNQIRELDTAVYASMNEKQLMTQNYRENIVDHNNHSMDDLKYFMNSQPKQRQRTANYRNMVSRWLK
jgi:hypothetical protein